MEGEGRKWKRKGENLAGGKSCYSKEDEEEEDTRYYKKGVTKKIMRGAIKLIRGSEVNEVEGGQRRGVIKVSGSFSSSAVLSL